MSCENMENMLLIWSYCSFSLLERTHGAHVLHTHYYYYYYICLWPTPNKEKSGRRRGVNDVRPKTGLSRRGSVAVVGPIDVVIILLLLRTTLRDLENSAPARVFARRQPAGRSTGYGDVALTLSSKHIFLLPAPVFFPFFFAPSPPTCFFSNPIHSFISTHV